MVNPIPEGYHTVTPYLTVPDAAGLIAYLEKAFDARTKFKMQLDDGRITHAEIVIGDSPVMIGQARTESEARKMNLYVYVADCDAAYQKAMRAGGKSVMEPADQFYGDRNAGVEDPAGNQWWIGTHVEDVPPEELKKRAKAARG